MAREPLDASRADLQRRELRLQVTPQHLGLADVLQDNRTQVLVEAPVGYDPDGRDAQAFLKDLGRARAVASGGGSADIEVVAERSDEADPTAVAEHGLESDDVRQMLAAA